MTSHRRSIIITALLVLGTLSACGGDDDDDDGGEALTEAEFITQADAICQAGDEALDDAANEAFSSGEPDGDTFEAFIDDELKPNLSDQFDDIRALDGPDDFEADVDELLDSAEDRLAELDDMSGDEILELFSSGEDPFAEVNDQAKALGFTACGGGSEDS